MRKLIDRIVGRYYDIEAAIKNPKKVRVLKLVEFENKNFHENDILSFVHLKELSLHYHPDTDTIFTTKLSQLKKLRKLHILNYPFFEFPDWLFGLKNLENLMLRGNDIKVIPERIIELSKLKHLRLENTDIDSIPKSIKSLVDLKSLSLCANNKLKTIEATSLPPNLKWLLLSPSGMSQEEINKVQKEFKKEMPDLRFHLDSLDLFRGFR